MTHPLQTLPGRTYNSGVVDLGVIRPAQASRPVTARERAAEGTSPAQGAEATGPQDRVTISPEARAKGSTGRAGLQGLHFGLQTGSHLGLHTGLHLGLQGSHFGLQGSHFGLQVSPHFGLQVLHFGLQQSPA